MGGVATRLRELLMNHSFKRFGAFIQAQGVPGLNAEKAGEIPA
jgi:hypothetical protein